MLVLESEPVRRLVEATEVDGQGKDLVGSEELEWVRVTDKRELEESLICLSYSSGTTGVPKGALLYETYRVLG